jgi:hypothetical protein
MIQENEGKSGCMPGVLGLVGEVLTSAVIWGVLALTAGAYFLYRGLSHGDTTAYAVLGGLLTLALAGIGGGAVLGVLWAGYRFEAGRDRREQARFRDNTRENLALMTAQANAQTAQARMLSSHQAALTRALPDPRAGAIEGDFVRFDPALLAGIDEELGAEVD